MSDRLCNRCEFEHLRANAEQDRKIVEVQTDPGALGGVNVYVRYSESPLDTEVHFVAWYMELSEDCAC